MRGRLLILSPQMFVGREPVPHVSHSVGAAQILKCRGYAAPRDEFERILLLSLRGPIVSI